MSFSFTVTAVRFGGPGGVLVPRVQFEGLDSAGIWRQHDALVLHALAVFDWPAGFGLTAL